MSLRGALFATPVFFLLTGCASVTYYWQAVGGQIQILRNRKPMESILADPTADAELKSSLETVQAIRRFATRELALPENDSYTTYVDLGRPYVVWNVVAAEEFSIDPVRWCFPFAGCVPYRGYFDRARAETFQAKLEAKGYDTFGGGARAYSTLGYFKDPVLSTMIAGGSDFVASLLFHELAHQKVYFRDDTELSEAFASLIEEVGTERWLAATDGDARVQTYGAARRRRAEFSALVVRQQERLRALYDSDLPVDEKRREKVRSFDRMRDEYAALSRSWGGQSDYDAWFAEPLNNARLAAVATYTRWVPVLERRLESLGLDDFYAEMATLEKASSEERRVYLEAWSNELAAER
jgi:predicted aminopeptidase